MSTDQTGEATVPCLGRLVSDSFAKVPFTIEQIRTFLVVAGREHVTEAAKILALSQSAVTQQIQLLEKSLGVRLLERVGRNVRLTSAGVDIAAAALLVMRSVENLESLVLDLRGPDAGTVEVGVSQSAADYFIGPVLMEFRAIHPAVKVEVRVAEGSEVCDLVAAGELECGLLDGPVHKTSLVRATVAVDEVVLVANPEHDLAGSTPLQPAQLADTLLVCAAGTECEGAAARILGSAFSRVRRAVLPSPEAVRRTLLARRDVVAAIPRVAVEDDLKEQRLVTLAIRSAPRAVVAVRRDGPLGPAADAFWQTLTATSRDLGGERSVE